MKKHQEDLPNIYNNRGFDFYLRKMYVQKGTAEKTDYFKHANRKQCEQNVLNYIG